MKYILNRLHRTNEVTFDPFFSLVELQFKAEGLLHFSIKLTRTQCTDVIHIWIYHIVQKDDPIEKNFIRIYAVAFGKVLNIFK